MMQNHSLSKAKPSILSRRINVAGISAVAAAAVLMFSPESAQAGAKDLKALKKALTAAGVTVDNATPEQLVAAIIAAQGEKKVTLGGLVGEALKTKAALTGFAGDEIAAALDPASLTAAERQALAALAAKTAATGKGANVAEVKVFVKNFLQAGDDAVATAASAKTPAAVAGILEGFASNLQDDGEEVPEPQRKTALQKQIELANNALGQKKLAKALPQIAAGVAATVVDGSTDEYALAVSESYPKIVSKIAGGIAATDPQNAGEIVKKLIDTGNADLKTNLQKGIPAIAKSVAAVADIEQISLIGAYLAEKIGANATAGPKSKPLVPIAKAKALTTTLAKAIIAKPSGAGSLSAANRADELAEVAANVVGGIINVSAGFDAKKAPKLVLSIIQAAVKGGTASKKQAQQAAAATYISDIVASVAHTLASSSLDAATVDAIKTFLLKPANAKKIDKKNSAAVIAALDLGFAATTDDQNGGLENGNLIANAIRNNLALPLDRLVDPETDKHDYTAL